MRIRKATLFQNFPIFFGFVAIIFFLCSCSSINGGETMVEIELPTCVTGKCHNDIGVKEFVHHPVRKGACIMCHKLVAKKHPDKKKDKTDFEMWGSEEGICYICHLRKDQNQTVHMPVAEGQCTVCHDPHQSENGMRLKRGANGDLCYNCHEKFSERIKSEKYVHKPVKKGKCLVCHVPHGTDERAMLRKKFPEMVYLTYNVDNFALCFTCHDKGITEEPVTEKHTRFRNGNENLHNKHVNAKPKGLNCKICHDIHAGPMPAMMTSQIDTQPPWRVQIKYDKTESGGTCTTSCHNDDETYDRVSPVE